MKISSRPMRKKQSKLIISNAELNRLQFSFVFRTPFLPYRANLYVPSSFVSRAYCRLLDGDYEITPPSLHITPGPASTKIDFPAFLDNPHRRYFHVFACLSPAINALCSSLNYFQNKSITLPNNQFPQFHINATHSPQSS